MYTKPIRGKRAVLKELQLILSDGLLDSEQVKTVKSMINLLKDYDHRTEESKTHVQIVQWFIRAYTVKFGSISR